MNKLAFGDLLVPNCTTLCRRSRELDVVLPTLCSGEPLQLVVDSTGLNVFGEGEWKVRKHGYSKRRLQHAGRHRRSRRATARRQQRQPRDIASTSLFQAKTTMTIIPPNR
jgi:hypothetical protein